MAYSQLGDTFRIYTLGTTYVDGRILYEETVNTSAVSSNVNLMVQAKRSNNYDSFGTGTLTIDVAGFATWTSAISPSQKVAASWTQIGGTRSLTIPHNSAGDWSGAVTVSSSGNLPAQLTFSNVSRTMTLTHIATEPPTITITATPTVNGVNFTATSNKSLNSDSWRYRIKAHSSSTWPAYSTPPTRSATSCSGSYSGLTSGIQYDIEVRGYIDSSRPGSKTASFTTYKISTLNSTSYISGQDAVGLDNSATAKFDYTATVYDSRVSHRLIFYNGSTAYYTNSSFSVSSSGSVNLWSAPATAILNAMKDIPVESGVRQFTCKVTLASYAGSTLLGTSSREMIFRATEENSAPTFSSVTVEDTANARSIFDIPDQGSRPIIIQNLSNVKITIGTVRVATGASIASYSVTIGNHTTTGTSNVVTMGTIPEKNNENVAYVSVIDNRNWKWTLEVPIYWIAYEEPSVTLMNVKRENNYGDRIIVNNFLGVYSTVTARNSSNVLVSYNSIESFSFRYKKTTESEWSEYVDIKSRSGVRISDGSISFSTVGVEPPYLIELSNTFAYNIEFKITDKRATYIVQTTVASGFPMISVSSQGVAFGERAPNEKKFKINTDWTMDGPLASATNNGLMKAGDRAKIDNTTVYQTGGGDYGMWHFAQYSNGYRECWGMNAMQVGANQLAHFVNTLPPIFNSSDSMFIWVSGWVQNNANSFVCYTAVNYQEIDVYIRSTATATQGTRIMVRVCNGKV